MEEKEAPKLTVSQQRAVEDREGSVLVAAAAGSGKTKVLVERLLQRVEGTNGHPPVDIDRFLVITFTKAAAAELRGRIAQELNRRLAKDLNNHHLRRQLTLVYQTQISTIHAFCAKVIKENGHLLDINPSFRLCEESEAQIMLEQVLEQVLEEEYAKGDPTFYQLVDSLSLGRDDGELQEIILDIFRKIQSHPHPQQWLEGQKTMWDLGTCTKVEETIWGCEVLNNAKLGAEYALTQIQRAMELCRGDLVLQTNYLPSLSTTQASIEKFIQAAQVGWDQAKEALPILFPSPGTKRKVKSEDGVEFTLLDPDMKDLVSNIRKLAKEKLEKLSLGGTSLENLQDLQATTPLIHTLVELVSAFSLAFTQEKRQKNLLDFGDLEHIAVELLVKQDGSPTSMAEVWSDRLTEVMVDEYQDTNQVQNAIFNAVSHQGRNLFVVGDVKQSIYQFRLADPSIFLEKFHRFSENDPPKPGVGRVVMLSENFRSRPEVLEGCNDLFTQLMTPEFGGIDYTKESLVPGAAFVPERVPHSFSTELWVLDTSECVVNDIPVKNHLIEARWVANHIRKLVDSGFEISENQTLRPVEYKDIMVLIRSPGKTVAEYILALEGKGIPWVTQGGNDMFQTTEVNVALSVLAIVDNPRQDIPLLASLRSPVFGFTSNELALMRGNEGGDVYELLVSTSHGAGGQPALTEKCKKFLALLEGLRFGVGDKTPRQLVWQVFEQTNMLGIFGATSGGEARQNNLLELYALLGRLEDSGYATLFACLHHLDQLAKGDNLPQPNLPQREELGVNIMTIHRSKGLEKPVVIVAGLARSFNTQDSKRPVVFHQDFGLGPKRLHPTMLMQYPTIARTCIQERMVQEMMEEELRLLYVAMTRAREKLILSVALSNGLDEVDRLKKYLSVPLQPMALRYQQSVGKWVLLYAMGRGDGKIPLNVGDVTGESFPNRSRWDIQVVNCRSLAESPTAVLTDAESILMAKIEAEEAKAAEEGTLSPEEEASLLGSAPGLPEEDGSATDSPTEEGFTQEELDQVEVHRKQFLWEYDHAQEVEAPSKFTATQSKGKVLHLDEEGGLQVVEGERSQGFDPEPPPKNPFIYREKPRAPVFYQEEKGMTGAQRGTAMHLVMQYMDIATLEDGSVERVKARLEGLVASGHLSLRQCEAVSAEQISYFLTSPLGEKARRASVCQQEFKFSLLVEGHKLGVDTQEELLLQGVVDCWFQDEEGITIIDFKSDAVSPGKLGEKTKEHGNQMAVYAMALQRILGAPVAHKVLWFFDQDCAMECE